MRRLQSFLFAAILLSSLLPAFAQNDPFDRGDIFEFHNLREVKTAPMWIHPDTQNTFDPLDLFGATLGTQEVGNGEIAFADTQPPGSVDWVEFETMEPVALQRYNVALRADWVVSFYRTTSWVRLLAADKTGVFRPVDSFVPNYSPLNNPPWVLQVAPGTSHNQRTLTNVVVARLWRIEFQRDNRSQQGVRAIEVDGYAAENSELPTVTILNPKPDDLFFSDGEVPIEISASDPNGIDQVEVYANDLLIGAKSSNFNFTWKNPPPNNEATPTHVITARAIDKLGAVSTASVLITVIERPLEIRTVLPRLADGFIHFDVVGGIEGRNQVILGSADLINWSPVKTITHSGETWTFSEAIGTALRFYKVVQLPAAPSE